MAIINLIDQEALNDCPAGNSEFCFPEILCDSKVEKKDFVCFTPAGSQICLGFKEHDLITWKSKVQVVVSIGSFVRPRRLVSFDPRHVTRFSPIGKRI